MNRSFVPSWRVVLLLVSILGLPLAPQRSSAAPAAAWPATRVLKYPNGPTVLLAPDPLAGSVEVGLWYAAGTRNDPPRTSGLAMAVGRTLFRSSEAIERSLQAEGSSSSEVMTPDLTARSLVLPAERVSLGLQAVAGWLKPRAIGTSDLRIALARAHEDRAARAAGSPILPAIETMLATGYSGHPYAAPVLGREADEARITVAAVKADLASRFAPSRALITIVGRFDATEAMRTLDQALGGAAVAAPKRVAGKAPVFPPSKGGTQQAAIGVAVPLSLVGWRGPSASDPDSPAFDLLSHLLVGGAAPYGQRALTEQEGAVAQVLGGVDRRIDASIVFLVAVSQPDSMRTAAKHVVDGIERPRS
jgi:predicted Zn-dependent peptidase